MSVYTPITQQGWALGKRGAPGEVKSSDETLKLSFSLVGRSLSFRGLESAGLGPSLSISGAKRSVWTRFWARVTALAKPEPALFVLCSS